MLPTPASTNGDAGCAKEVGDGEALTLADGEGEGEMDGENEGEPLPPVAAAGHVKARKPATTLDVGGNCDEVWPAYAANDGEEEPGRVHMYPVVEAQLEPWKSAGATIVSAASSPAASSSEAV